MCRNQASLFLSNQSRRRDLDVRFLWREEGEEEGAEVFPSTKVEGRKAKEERKRLSINQLLGGLKTAAGEGGSEEEEGEEQRQQQEEKGSLCSTHKHTHTHTLTITITLTDAQRTLAIRSLTHR